MVNLLHYDCGTGSTSCPVEPWLHGSVPDLLPMHTEYFMFYEPAGRASCYSFLGVLSGALFGEQVNRKPHPTSGAAAASLAPRGPPRRVLCSNGVCVRACLLA